jgi:hypothetical protein
MELQAQAQVQEELAKFILPSDVVTEVEPTTESHYSLNLRFEVIREEKKYFISIKKVNVMGEMKRHHVRLEVDTDLPKPKSKAQIAAEKKYAKILELEALMRKAKAEKNRYAYNFYHAKWERLV